MTVNERGLGYMFTNKDDVKIFILCLLSSIGYPLTYDEAHDVSVQDGQVSAFDYIEAFDELIESENLVRQKVDGKGEDLIVVSAKGKYVAETLGETLPASIREKTLKNALRHLSFKKRGTKISSEATKLPHGKYEFKCSIKDDEGDIMELKLLIDNPRQLDKTMHNFENKTEHIYKGIVSLLAGDASYFLE